MCRFSSICARDKVTVEAWPLSVAAAMTTMLQHSFLQMPGGNFSELFKDVVVKWCNPLTLQSEQSGGVGLIPSTAHHLRVPTRCHGLGAKNRNFTFTF